MTRKDYIKIARVIKDNTSVTYIDNGTIANVVKDSLIDDLCIMFKQDNSLFDRQRFVDACE